MSEENVNRLIILSEQLKVISQYDKVARGKLKVLRYKDNFFKISEMKNHLGLNSSDATELSRMVDDFELNMSVFLSEVKTNVVSEIKKLK